MKSTVLTALLVGILLSVTNIASADTFGTDANQFTIDFVTISGDTNPTSGYGIVNNDYRIATYEVTNDQWSKFVNVYGTVTGSPSSAYDDSAAWAGTNIPTTNVSWYECAQFVNYLNTSTNHQAAYKFTGTKGQSDYTFAAWDIADDGYDSSNPYRNSNAYYFLPTEDEWVKAAYWSGMTLQTYATPDDSFPVEDDEVNYNPEPGAQPWNVGSGSEELNGTFDMMGNIGEWNETLSDSSRGIRGGSYNSSFPSLQSSDQNFTSPYYDYDSVGFRVASVPEPCSLVILSLGGLVLLRKRRVS